MEEKTSQEREITGMNNLVQSTSKYTLRARGNNDG